MITDNIDNSLPKVSAKVKNYSKKLTLDHPNDVFSLETFLQMKKFFDK